MLNATSDEGDDGVGSVIDTTKVTSSTLGCMGAILLPDTQNDSQ